MLRQSVERGSLQMLRRALLMLLITRHSAGRLNYLRYGMDNSSNAIYAGDKLIMASGWWSS